MSQENGLVHVRLCPDLRTGGFARKPPVFLLCDQDGRPFCDEGTGSCVQVDVGTNERLMPVVLSDVVSVSYAWILKGQNCKLVYLVSGHDHKILISSEVGRREILTGLFAGSVFMVDVSMASVQQPVRREFVDFAASEIAA